MGAISKMIGEVKKADKLPEARLDDWGRSMAKSGQAKGLWILLAALDANPSRSTLQSFEHLSGMSVDRWKKRLPDPKDQPLEARVKAARKWLEANEKNIFFSAKAECFWPKKRPVEPPRKREDKPEVF